MAISERQEPFFSEMSNPSKAARRQRGSVTERDENDILNIKEYT
jgi:hypothetical protein